MYEEDQSNQRIEHYLSLYEEWKAGMTKGRPPDSGLEKHMGKLWNYLTDKERDLVSARTPKSSSLRYDYDADRRREDELIRDYVQLQKKRHIMIFLDRNGGSAEEKQLSMEMRVLWGELSKYGRHRIRSLTHVFPSHSKPVPCSGDEDLSRELLQVTDETLDAIHANTLRLIKRRAGGNLSIDDSLLEYDKLWSVEPKVPRVVYTSSRNIFVGKHVRLALPTGLVTDDPKYDFVWVGSVHMSEENEEQLQGELRYNAPNSAEWSAADRVAFEVSEIQDVAFMDDFLPLSFPIDHEYGVKAVQSLYATLGDGVPLPVKHAWDVWYCMSERERQHIISVYSNLSKTEPGTMT